MDALECIMTRRSCRSYKADMPKPEEISAVVEAARYAPSGMSRQTWHFTVVTDKDWLARMNERVYGIVNEQSKDSNLDRNGAKGYSCNYHSPVFIIVSADPAYGTSAGDCACALENMFLAAHALGLGSCWINQLGGENCAKVRDLLSEAGVPVGDLVYGCCSLGYPDAAPAPRKPRTDSVIYYPAR